MSATDKRNGGPPPEVCEPWPWDDDEDDDEIERGLVALDWRQEADILDALDMPRARVRGQEGGRHA